jgi:hypothetical protein
LIVGGALKQREKQRGLKVSGVPADLVCTRLLLRLNGAAMAFFDARMAL